jgi:hypothetical protein
MIEVYNRWNSQNSVASGVWTKFPTKFATKFMGSLLSPRRMHWDLEARPIEDEHENEDEDEIKTV